MRTVRVGALFAGYGGIELALAQVLEDVELAWYCEIEPAACAILAHRYPGVPNLGDVTTVDWANVPPVDVITGGSPCQDLSHAGKRQGMKAGTRSGLWASMCDAIDIIRPSLVVWENVRGALSAEADSALEPCPGCVGDPDDGAVLRALGRVLGDLAELRFDARWYGLRAADVGAAHGRFRVFLFATPADASDVGHERPGSARNGGFGPSDSGIGALALLPTPRATRGGSGTETRYLLPTPQAMDGTGAMTPAARAASGQGYGPALRDVGYLLPTPSVADAMGGHLNRSGDRSHELLLPGVARAMRETWGDYAPVIAHWGVVLGRPAPTPTEPGTKGGHRLSARFVEWLMGLPDGWVCDVPGITRNQALKALGNGVVPQQCAAALWAFLHDSGWGLAA